MTFEEWWEEVSQQTCFLAARDAETVSATRVVAHSAWVQAQRQLKAEMDKLEAKMEAIGAGGVTREQRLMNPKFGEEE